MMPQSAPIPSFLKPQSPHLHFDGETCPWCEQEIPPERLEEIRGKIATREREQRDAITAKLEQQYAIDKEQADAKAKADLELERRQSAAREAAAREEARKAAEAAAAEKLADAQAKTAEAEERLGSLREVMEKDKDDAINAKEAKFFAEKQKLTSEVNDLQRKLANMTAAELGEGAEINLYEALKKAFADDRIERVRKGAPGADILHGVMHNGRECGTIIYDSKNRMEFRPEHVTKLREYQLAAKAEHAILSTRKFPPGASQLHMRDGVLLANPARVVSVVILIRQHLLQVHTLRLSNAERTSKTAALYAFITSERCAQHISTVDAYAAKLLEHQVKEKKWHDDAWKKEGELIRKIQKVQADLSNEISCIIGTAADDEVALEDLNDDQACQS
jgi:hypothetical protein